MNTTTPIILASNSPRRQELLHTLGIDFKVATAHTEETWPVEMENVKVPEYLATRKATALVSKGEEALVIAADTEVILGGKILGKPQTRQQALQMLQNLSDQTHQVVTGVCLQQKQRIQSFHDITQVTFHPLEDQEITYYLDTYGPYDKAGAYGIQEWIGMIGVKSIRGSYYNVMGLPVNKVYQALKAW